MRVSARQWMRILALVGVMGLVGQAQAIPAFARKYGTSCQTCHTVYPKLNPFGEAFRRNGYRFPGVDSDYVKKDSVALGQEAYKQVFPNAVWPGTLPVDVPIAVGFNGQAMIHPDPGSSGGKADNGTSFTMNDLIAEGHVWAGGSFDDKNTFWAELTFAGGGVEIEHAAVLFNDLVGPAHAVNVKVGRGFSTLTSFGPHSSYVGDTLIPSAPVTALYGATSDSFNVADKYNGIEATGVLGGQLDYSVGLNAGANVDIRPTENVYGHLGYKLGGLRLDGEGASGPSDPQKPWAENAVTIDVFAYHSNSRYTPAATDPNTPATDLSNAALTVGGGLRAQWGSLELNSGLYQESHTHAQADGSPATLLAQYNELSYVVFPWLVPAVRVEYLRLTSASGPAMTDLRIFPGIAALIRPNLKVTVVAQIESATGGAPPGGWGPAGGLVAPPDTTTVGPELEGIAVGIATAF